MSADDSNGNQAPRIEEFVLGADEVHVGQQVRIRAIVTDREGDEVGYTWTTTNGDFGGQFFVGGQVYWIPDKSGEATVRLIVSDGRATSDKSFTMDVLPE